MNKKNLFKPMMSKKNIFKKIFKTKIIGKFNQIKYKMSKKII